MKKSILILILAGLLTACVPTQEPEESSELSTAQEVTEASESEKTSESEEEGEILCLRSAPQGVNAAKRQRGRPAREGVPLIILM